MIMANKLDCKFHPTSVTMYKHQTHSADEMYAYAISKPFLHFVHKYTLGGDHPELRILNLWGQTVFTPKVPEFFNS